MTQHFSIRITIHFYRLQRRGINHHVAELVIVWRDVANNDVVRTTRATSPVYAAVEFIEMQGAVDTTDSTFRSLARVIQVIVIRLCAKSAVDRPKESIKVQYA